VRRTRLTVAVLAIGAIAITGCGAGAGDTSSAPQTVTSTVTTESTNLESQSSASTQSENVSFERYDASAVHLDRPAGWVTEEDETPKSTFLESKWHDPSDPATTILVDTLPSSSGSAEADARSVESQTSSSSGYKEISFGPATIAGYAGWKWVFELPGSERVDYFVNTCGTSIALLGTTSPRRFGTDAGIFSHVARSLQPTCATGATSTAASTDSVTTSTGDFCATHTCIPNFPNGTGYIVQCSDGEWSHSGGRPGACSYHGGETGTTYP
jgi:hypothetical protein